MIQSIDHIVIAVHSLDSAIDSYRALGFTVVVGGKHPYGSHNALIGFEDGSYIEVLGFYEESPAHPWWDLLHQRGGGLIDFCMATDDIRGDLAHFERRACQCGRSDRRRSQPSRRLSGTLGSTTRSAADTRVSFPLSSKMSQRAASVCPRKRFMPTV